MTGIVVAGMHRSGTSLMTRFLVAGGWHPGDDLLSSETEQYLEHAPFVALHRAWLEACLPGGEGHRDWGVSDAGTVAMGDTGSPSLAAMSSDASSFVDQRERERARWVAKDPRATLFLPVWGGIESLKFVLVYRNPWDVVDSAVRLGADVFCRHPRYALDAWLDHNRRLVEFVAAHRDRCVVIASEQLIHNPARVWERLREMVGLDGDVPHDLRDASRYVLRDEGHPIARLYRETHPAHCAVLDELDRLADVPRADPGGSRTAPSAPPTGTETRPRAAGVTRRAVVGGSLPPGTGVQVVVPCRDDGDFLLEAVASVDVCALLAHARTGHDQVELTIVDDGSTDGETLRVLEVLRSTGRQVLSTPASGLASARNAGLAASNTLAVIPLDADNRLRFALVEALGDIERDEFDIVHGPWQRCGADRTATDPPALTLDSLIPSNTIDACAIVSRALIEQLGGWDQSLLFWEDWDLWLGAVGAGARARRIDEITHDYLVRPGSLATMAIREPAERERAVEHITTKHVRLLGPSLARLVAIVHRFDSGYRDLETQHLALETAYRDLETRHLALESAYRQLETAYRELETGYRELESGYRALEAHHLARGD